MDRRDARATLPTVRVRDGSLQEICSFLSKGSHEVRRAIRLRRIASPAFLNYADTPLRRYAHTSERLPT